MYWKVKPFAAIKNVQKPEILKDFRMNPPALLVLALFLAGGIIWQFSVTYEIDSLDLVKVAGGTIVSGFLLLLIPLWGLVLALIAGFWINLLALFTFDFYPLFLMVSLGLLFSPCVQIAHQWEKAIILRLGKFRKLKGPGIFLIFPLLDRVTRYVDTRIRATDFSAEKTITIDTVPVHVDALAFWMIWDARKAVLEVENFIEAVVLSAQAALRDSIGRHELADLLSERERLGREIQQALDRKTNPWGISILSIEITDIIIPKELENAMSKRAQAERERQSRVILGTAEVEISEKFVQAAERYKDNPTALHLRAMNMIFEGIKQNGTIVLLPAPALSTMSLGGMLDDLAHGKVPEIMEGKKDKNEPGAKAEGKIEKEKEDDQS